MSQNTDYKIHVLLVDDEEDLHSLYGEIFKKKIKTPGVLLYNFYNGQQCLDFLAKGLPSGKIVLITDINMPIMDGFELLENLKVYGDQIERWVMSAYNNPEFVTRSEQFHCKGFLSKPVSYKKIIDIVSES